MFKFLVCLVFFITLIELVDLTTNVIDYKKSLSKILGLNSNSRNPELSGDTMNEIMKVAPVAPKNSGQVLDRDDVRRLRRVIGHENMELIRQNIIRRRRTSNRYSIAGRRRDRLQSIRRDKLKNQSIRSHAVHARKNLAYAEAIP